MGGDIGVRKVAKKDVINDPEKTTEKNTEKILCIVKTNPQMTYKNLLKHEVWYDENIHLVIR